MGQFFKNESRLSDIKNTPFSGDIIMSHRKKKEATQDANHARHRKGSGGGKSNVYSIGEGGDGLKLEAVFVGA